MTAATWRLAPPVAALLFVALLLPPSRRLLESSMTLQMLVQLPLLISTGYLLREAVPAPLAAAIARWNRHGISGLVLASLAGMFWMLPRSLDAAVSLPWTAFAKFVSVPLLIGLLVLFVGLGTYAILRSSAANNWQVPTGRDIRITAAGDSPTARTLSPVRVRVR